MTLLTYGPKLTTNRMEDIQKKETVGTTSHANTVQRYETNIQYVWEAKMSQN